MMDIMLQEQCTTFLILQSESLSMELEAQLDEAGMFECVVA